MALFPRVAHFLVRETERAKVVADDCDLRGIVRMGSQVRYCEDKAGDIRNGVLVPTRSRYFAETAALSGPTSKAPGFAGG
jgi:hypothetical protein